MAKLYLFHHTAIPNLHFHLCIILPSEKFVIFVNIIAPNQLTLAYAYCMLNEGVAGRVFTPRNAMTIVTKEQKNYT